jgi:anaphase-promoting complex subunit 4
MRLNLFHSATDLFAFQGGLKRSLQNTKFPDVIANWPSLPPDPVAASIKAPSVGMHPGEELDERDDRNDDSVLCACDDMGNVHCFLDGSFPLGTFPFNTNNATGSLFKDAKKPIFYTHIRSSSSSGTDLAPTIVKVPLLEQRIVRDVARTCSAAKELTWYVMRSIKEMRTAWCGSEYQNGAKEVGHKWIVTLETKQRDQFGRTSQLLKTGHHLWKVSF